MSVVHPKSIVRRRGPQARSVGSFVAKLTGKAFEKYGFSTVMLLTDWTAIVGDDLARYTQPERLKWPRNVDAFDETATDQRGRPGATLVLRVESARSLDVQYQSAQIIERINAYFGYQAVTQLRFVQAPVDAARPSSPSRNNQRAPAVAAPQSAQHTEDGLQAALARLKASIQKDTARRESDNIPV